MGTKKGQKRKTARRAYEPKNKWTGRVIRYGPRTWGFPVRAKKGGSLLQYLTPFYNTKFEAEGARKGYERMMKKK